MLRRIIIDHLIKRLGEIKLSLNDASKKYTHISYWTVADLNEVHNALSHCENEDELRLKMEHLIGPTEDGNIWLNL